MYYTRVYYWVFSWWANRIAYIPLSNGLHDLFCQSRKCYTPAEGCVCKFCNSPADHKSHIVHCRWATKDEPFELNVSNINMIVKMLQCMNTT